MFASLVEQSLAFLPFALGLFISFHILKIADLTVDGTFVLGAGLYAKLVSMGCVPTIALLAALAAGSAAGLGVALIQRGGRVPPLIAGILALFILQSLTLQLMGRPTISLLGSSFSMGLPLSIAAAGALLLLLRSRLGLLMRAFGSNATLLQLMGRSPERYRMAGLAISNGLVALSGVLTAQLHGFADIGMGMGLVLIAIAVVIIGQQLVCRFSEGRFSVEILGCFAGSLLYFSAVHIFVSIGIPPVALKMAIGLSLVVLLMTSRQKELAEVAK
jgi:putative tryptophan/tyrosine transport system permease protein